ncbi:MAG: sigma factor [Anaerolineae bacterium]|nr:sigma factor [Anaerolineae bacterium]
MRRYSDELLLQQIARRNITALEELYDRHAQAVYTLICHIVREKPIANRVLQDTFWQVWSEARNFPENGTASTWIYRIARTSSLAELRQHPSPTTPSNIMID